jgi:caffeoyl-CoA O-methyltransferase
MKKQGIPLFDEKYSEWIQKNLLPPLLKRHEELENYSLLNKLPIIDRFGGFYLKNLIRRIQPSLILELGTGPGFSTYFMVEPNLKPYTIRTVDRRKENLETAHSFLDLCNGTNCNVDFIENDIMTYLDTNRLELKNFQMAFIDCDKVLYPHIFEILKEFAPQIHMVFDNVFWRGRLIDPDPDSKSDQALISFWEQIKTLDVHYEIYPCEDGMLYLPPFFCLEN